jgi:hypothetical protein
VVCSMKYIGRVLLDIREYNGDRMERKLFI